MVGLRRHMPINQRLNVLNHILLGPKEKLINNKWNKSVISSKNDVFEYNGQSNFHNY